MASNRSKPATVALYLFLAIVVVVTLVPLLYTVSASFKTNPEIMTGGAQLIPHIPTLDNYEQIWTLGNFGYYTWNSLRLSLTTMVFSVFLTSMAAYVFNRAKFPGKKFLYWLVLSTMFLSAGSIALYPILRLATNLSINNLWGVSLVQAGTTGATNLILSIGYLRTISREIDEAARIDGCSFFRIYWNIILPLSKPILATVALLAYRHAWNDYLLPRIMTMGTGKYPLTVGIVLLQSAGGQVASQYNLMMAGTMCSIIPMVTIYLVMNRYFVTGMTAGAVKG